MRGIRLGLVLLAILLLIGNRERISEALSPPEPITGVVAGEVVLYATSWCGYCEQTRKFLRARQVPYVEHDIERSAAARREFELLNGRGVPLLVIRGKVVHGYNPQAMRAALQP